MNIIIAGGTGLIGTALTRSLLTDGHTVTILTRSSGRTNLQPGAQSQTWDGRSPGEWTQVLAGADAVVNLAGATIGQWPWSAERKKQILESRINAGQAFALAFEKVSPRPRVYLQASGVGYYGPRGLEPLNEDVPAGNDFLANIALQWETSTRLLDSMGVRRAIIRTGLVLDAHGGVLPLMALPVRLFAGGPIGDGKQGISWIHLQDEVRAIRFLLENDQARGAFNLTAPNPLSNAHFMRALAQTLHRPHWLPVPAFAMRLALGEMSALLLTGQYVIPQKLVNLGFGFNFESARDALNNIYR
ncbi:MAG: TIGR01777 family protein [Anaerolineae bacterium CG_4_9_14_3_um_filter_57_17]|nr:TIGR01777 family protein [bacterium]NCT21195.1 TIGR01777 family protein [bacterium]OIO84229.1 MAG: TIGR01777 family protein [Anaerolineae bacterium CG2_30_57_67]PJB68573.1 MAG: TIGR01777 family protein [Anaerolineae bacterium CG_4_9_14_3_um_filter_57_17]